MRTPPRRSSRLAAILLCAATSVSCGDDAPWPDPSSGSHSVLRTSDRGLAVPRGPDSTIIERSADLDVARGELFVLDGLGRKVLRFGRDGGVRNVFGREGEGPGELANPVRIVVRDSVVWIGDTENGRVVGFNYGGRPVASVPLPVGSYAWTFSPRPDGTLLVPSLERSGLLARLDSTGSRELAVRPSLPPELSGGGSPLDRFRRAGITGRPLASSGPGGVYLLVNSGEPSLWHLEIQGDTVTAIARVPLPGELVRRLVADARRLTEALSGQTGGEVTATAFEAMRPTRDGAAVWLHAGALGTRMTGVEISRRDRRPTYVVPRAGQGRGVKRSLLRDGRLYVLQDTLVRIHSVHPAAPPRGNR